MSGLTTDQEDRPQAQGREDLFERIFYLYWPKIYAMLARLLNGDEAEDVALETFLRLHQRPWQWKDEQNVSSWLYRVALNLGLNALRSQQRRRHYETQAGMAALQNPSPEEPEKALERAQKRQQVRAALAQMKPRAAQLLLLRHSGLSYAEIAAALNIRPASVGTLLARAEIEFQQRYRSLEAG